MVGLRNVEEEDGGAFVEVGERLEFPFADGEGADGFAGGGEVAGDGEEGVGAEGAEHLLEEFEVAVRGFDEQLGAVFEGGLAFVVFQGAGALVAFDGEVAVERECLSVEAGGDEREEDGGGTDEGHHAVAVAVGKGDEFRAGIGDAGAAGFGDDADVAGGKVGEAGFDVAGGGVFVHFQEGEFVEGKSAVYLLEVAAGVFGIFAGEHAKRCDAPHDFRGDDAGEGGFA